MGDFFLNVAFSKYLNFSALIQHFQAFFWITVYSRIHSSGGHHLYVLPAKQRKDTLIPVFLYILKFSFFLKPFFSGIAIMYYAIWVLIYPV
jgi:hypothetical protein